jgi:2,3-bisphosphoglycerate-independent phosphoglycerate mutase
MDRDKRWERNEKAWRAMVLGEGLTAVSAEQAVKQSYQKEVTDEFVEPTVIVDDRGEPRGLIKDGDSIIFFNFRSDRARQITRAFVDQDFQGFERPFQPEVYYVCFTQYDATIKAPVAFMPETLSNTLGEYLARLGLHQLRIAETEKYAHVTFFFNGGVEQPNINEDRALIPSPKVATYDLKPEMSAREVTERVIAEIERQIYDFVVLNYANPDMVGHTGNIEAAIIAVKTVDECLEQVVHKVLALGGVVLLTADHGNAELMTDKKTGQPHTAHTTNRVPFVLIGDRYIGRRLWSGGSLCDIAPTLLEVMELPVPPEMTGKSLLAD